MKYAFMSFSTPEHDLEQMLDLARRHGYDGIEPRLDRGHQHGVELDIDVDQRADIHSRLAESPVAICALAISARLAFVRDREAQLEQTRQAIELAHDLDVPCIRVFGGLLDDESERPAALDRLRQGLSALAPEAADAGVRLVLETHDSWTNPDHVAAAVEHVAHSAVGVNWDPAHSLRLAGWSIDASHERLRPWIHHAHAHDGMIGEGRFRITPMGEGEIDHQPVVARLREDGYEGYISLEMFTGEDPEVQLPREIEVLRQYERESSGSGESAGSAANP